MSFGKKLARVLKGVVDIVLALLVAAVSVAMLVSAAASLTLMEWTPFWETGPEVRFISFLLWLAVAFLTWVNLD